MCCFRRQCLLYSLPVGEDGYTRFWDLREGRRLYSLPPPCATSVNNIPCVQLSSSWADRDGNCGLIMALQENLHYYGRIPLR